MRTVLLNVTAHEESTTPVHCILIRERGYTNHCLSFSSVNEVTTLRKEHVRTCNSAIRLPLLVSRGFCCLSPDHLWGDWSLTVQNWTQEPVLQMNTVTIYYHQCNCAFSLSELFIVWDFGFSRMWVECENGSHVGCCSMQTLTDVLEVLLPPSCGRSRWSSCARLHGAVPQKIVVSFYFPCSYDLAGLLLWTFGVVLWPPLPLYVFHFVLGTHITGSVVVFCCSQLLNIQRWRKVLVSRHSVFNILRI
jgi:hypothetical protein